jgi:Domain of unknown function (DUF4349)
MTLRTTALAASLVLVTACGRGSTPTAGGAVSRTKAVPGSVQEPTSMGAAAGPAAQLAGADLTRLERKIARTADLAIESDDPRRAAVSARAMAEELGGYVATSDIARDERGDEDADLALSMVLRVPSDRFSLALEKLKALAARVAAERVNAEDVTEEFIDLNARLGSERALEAQFVEILKQARSVKDALEVHTQLAQVRSDIDKLEGRKQFLESQTSLCTIHLAVTRHDPVVRASWFGVGASVKRAASDAAGTTAAIVHGAIRILGFAAPILVLIVAPLVFLAGAMVRRGRRGKSQWSAGKC